MDLFQICKQLTFSSSHPFHQKKLKRAVTHGTSRTLWCTIMGKTEHSLIALSHSTARASMTTSCQGQHWELVCWESSFGLGNIPLPSAVISKGCSTRSVSSKRTNLSSSFCGGTWKWTRSPRSTSGRCSPLGQHVAHAVPPLHSKLMSRGTQTRKGCPSIHRMLLPCQQLFTESPLWSASQEAGGPTAVLPNGCCTGNIF